MPTVHTIPLIMSSAYLVECEDACILVDAGSPGEEQKILAALRAVGKDLTLIYVTHAHFDHYGSAAALRRITGAPVAIHAADAEPMARGETRLGSVRLWGHVTRALLPLVERLWSIEPVQADRLVAAGDDLGRYGLDATVLHTPGHTLGSTTLLTRSRAAFVGDLLSTTGTPHLQRLYAQDWSLLPQSVEHLQQHNPKHLYAGHGRHPAPGDVLAMLVAGGG